VEEVAFDTIVEDSSSSVSSELEENGDSSTDTEGRSEPHAVEESQEVILEVADEDQVDE
jgi:hypothetical protein